MKQIDLKEKGKLVITKQFKAEVDYYHEKYKKEWCGLPLYKLIKGSTLSPEEFVFVFHHFYGMNLGSETYTEFNNSNNTNGYSSTICDIYGDGFDCNYLYNSSLCHSHHSMNSFVSGTDATQIKEGVKDSLYYISLIVNNHTDLNGWVCKIAFRGSIEYVIPCKIIKSVLDSTTGEYVSEEYDDSKITKEDIIYLMDCNIILDETSSEGNITEDFIKRYTELEIENSKLVKSSFYKPGNWIDEKLDKTPNYYSKDSLKYDCPNCGSLVSSWNNKTAYCHICKKTIDINASSRIKIKNNYNFIDKKTNKSFLIPYLSKSLLINCSNLEVAIESANKRYCKLNKESEETFIDNIITSLDSYCEEVKRNNPNLDSDGLEYWFYTDCLNILKPYSLNEIVRDLIIFIKKQLNYAYEYIG